jgi:hypothetical protein
MALGLFPKQNRRRKRKGKIKEILKLRKDLESW